MRRVTLCLILTVAVLLAGCNGGQKKRWRLWPRSNEELMTDITSDDAARRRDAVLELADRKAGKEPAAVELFGEMLTNDPDPFVRAAAATALGNVGSADDLPALVRALEDESQVVRWDVAKALDRVVGPLALTPLSAHARKDRSIDVRIACTRALRKHRRPEAVLALADMMDDPDLSVRREAHRALVEIFYVDYGPDPKDWADAHTKPIPAEPPAKRSWWSKFRRSRRDREDKDADEPDLPPATDRPGG